MTSRAETDLQHWMIVLLNDPEYLAIYERIGTPAQRDEKATVIDRLKAFRTNIAAGIFPDSNTLAFVATGFAKYLEAARQGEYLSLDDAFGLPSKQRVGNPAKSDAAEEAKIQRCFAMREHLTRNPGATRLQAAEAVQRELDMESPECETMVRDYAEWKRVFDPPSRDEGDGQ
jgi:hypothetical protein